MSDGQESLRLRPCVEGSLHLDWKGKFQMDFGKAENGSEVAIKNACMQYKGCENMNMAIGNANFPFSREFLASFKYQELVARANRRLAEARLPWPPISRSAFVIRRVPGKAVPTRTPMPCCDSTS